MEAVPWNTFAQRQPELAKHAEERLAAAPCFLATVRRDGWPRVHPVGPFTLRDSRLVVTMYPTSPKAQDIRRTGRYAMHGPVEDTEGGGGEVLITGAAIEREPTAADRAKGYIIFNCSYARCWRPYTIQRTATARPVGVGMQVQTILLR